MDILRSIQMSECDIAELQRLCQEGELTEEVVADTIEAVRGEIGAKCDAIAEIVTANDGDIAALEAEVERLTAMLERLKLSNARLKEGLMGYLKRQGTPKVKTQYHGFSICKNGGRRSVELVGLVPEEYVRYVPRVDTDAVREALESGQELGFARLKERGEHLRIR